MKKLMPRRTHIRIFLGSCLLFVLVSVPVVFFMTRQFSSFALDQIDKVNKTELAHSRDNAAFILDKMIAYGFTMYADKSVQAWMTADEETQDREIEAIAAAAKYRTTEPFLKNAYLLNMRTGHVIDIAYGITTFAAFKDQAILELAKAPAKAYQRFFVHRAGGERSLALMIPTVPSGQPSYGYLVLLLDDALMKQYLLKENKAAGFISFMLDDEGRMMLGPDEEERAAAASETPGAAASETPGASNEGLYKELASRAEGASGSFEQRYDRESWSVQYARIEPQGWTLYLMAKLDGIHADFYAFRTKLMVVLAGLVALLLAILFWNSRRTYRPFSQLASHLETKLGPSLQRGQAGGAAGGAQRDPVRHRAAREPDGGARFFDAGAPGRH
ncbi:cache domain-containing protein [Cohnella rhizosphaerae]|uniref:Cache domain-containing protein n=1 Tax=Cohnella rhizosphaerae TaxID=1457232 RepID=A0A9X4KXC4_9BACL|nr:hypothetical protein [Cohnella rhizosphaerae]MDG0809979.1 cache domain-containing protein [Cohnella rhizosphaerae]